ncbi:hypothetical protein HMP09_1188 [Sphingomonas sp. HMP9]|nr:hypothetical protein HMP09_1188 [Sphingomonas sp. HMP9]
MSMRLGQEIQTVLRIRRGNRQSPAKEKLVPPARFEHAAYGLGNRRSIRLSYGGIGWGITPVGWDDQARG